MLEVYTKDRQKVAILQNASGIIEKVRINAVSNLEFSLPETDPKNIHCQKLSLVRYNGGELYRIIGEVIEEHETGKIIYRCEHVLALLLNDCIPEFVQVGGLGYYTRQVINYILNRQLTKHWVLKDCDFNRQFEYGWEKENLLSALFSVANRFTDKYQWVTNTKVYPYEISLKLFDENKMPVHYIRRGHNRLKLVKQSDAQYLCTRLYAYGAGEGVNQLNIANANSGKKYLQSPTSYIDQYGIIEKVWTDRRYTNIDSLKEAAQVMLNELQEPYEEYETEVIGDVQVGDTVEIVGYKKTYVVEIENQYGETPKRYIKIANKPQDIASSISDLADRQRIEMTYSQGATQVYAAQGSENADAATPFNISLFIPNEMININSVFAKIRIGRFRAYNTNLLTGGTTKTSSDGGATNTTSSAGGSTTSSDGGATTTQSGGGTTTSSGGGTNTTSSSGGATTTASGGGTSTSSGSGGGQTTTSGGGTNTSSGSGGGTSTTTGSGGQTTSGPSSITTTAQNQVTTGSVQMEDSATNIGKHNHGLKQGYRVLLTSGNNLVATDNAEWEPSGAHNHGTHNHNISHTHTLSTHNHSITLGNHTHSIEISSHSHSVSNHTHTISIDPHTHSISNHTHSVSIDNHTHSVSSHTHSISSHNHTIGNHTHTLTIGNHNHTIDTSHTHDITPKISFFGNPTQFALLINGAQKQIIAGTDAELDLTQHLVGADGRIPRGQWITIGIRPNDIAYVEVAYNIKGFCQSRGDVTV